MSNLDPAPTEATCGGRSDVATAPVRELLIGRDVVLGGPRGLTVTRTLPHRDRRMVGAWCFVDHYGPEDIGSGGPGGMRVPPHPHIGLQTVSWLVRGEVLHRDSLGSEQLIRPGQLNLMTAGVGISHAEESPADRTPILHGAQLWVALPAGERAVAPAFAHHGDLPVVARDGLTVTVLMGTLEDATSPARTYTPLVGAEVLIGGDGGTLALRPDFEYAVLAFEDGPVVDGEPVPAGGLVYLGTGRTELPLTGAGRTLVLGGEPFEEQIVMWWNFVGRSHDDIVAARADWEAGRGFGTVTGFDGAPLHAPELPTTPLKPRGRTR
ncbi:pirin family protein [Cryptosporangium minutisporangium]|uniref:Pirin family protein n=1 Tax=Cryptosporangium minutisporangium TaxID=113569 RepID=A0ABP6T713_9ACTN